MEKGITNRQMFFILMLITTSFRTTDIPQLVAKSLGRSGWIILLAYAVPFSLVALVMMKLNNMFKGMTIFEYGQILLGKVLSNIFCIFLFVYFFSILVYLYHSLNILISTNFLPKTKSIFTLAAATALCGFVVYKGTDTIARLFELLGILYLVATLIVCALMLIQSEPANILPLYNPNEGKEFAKSMLLFGNIYGGFENLLLIPFTQRNKGAPKVAFFSIFSIGLLYVLVTEGSIGLLGVNNAAAYKDAFVEAIKLTEAPVIERMDIFYLTFGLASLFAGLIILLHSLVQLLTKMLPLAKRGLIVSAVCAATYATTLLAQKIPKYEEAYQSLLPVMVLFFAGAVPVLLFIVAKLKKRFAAAKRGA